MKYRNFEEYYLTETKILTEGQQTYIGKTTDAEALPISDILKDQKITPPHNFCAHTHNYTVNSYGDGWTDGAKEGSSHEHQIIKWEIQPDGTHTHKLIKPTDKSDDGISLQVPVVTVATTQK